MQAVDPGTLEGAAPRGGGWLRVAPVWLSVAVAVAGVAVLAGWHLDVALLKSVLPNYITMKVNTAIGFIAIALAVLVLHREPVSRSRRAAGALLVALVAAIGVTTLSEYLLGRSFGVDELLHPDPAADGRFPPGRLAPITAVTFVLLAVALALSHLRRRPTFHAAHVLALLALLVGFQGFVGYLLGTTYQFGFAFYTQMAVHTTVLLVAVSVAILASRAERGLMSVLAGDTAGAAVARNLVGWAIVAPPLFGWIARLGERANLYDSDFTVLFRVVGNSVFFAVLVWRNAVLLHRVDLQRRRAERRRERLYAEARDAIAAREQAIRARDEFLSLASHELKTPLTPLRLRVQQLRRCAAPAPGAAAEVPRATVLETTEHLERHIGRLTALVEGLLETSRLSAGDLELAREQVPVQPLVRDCIADAAWALRSAGCEVREEVPADLAVVGDAPRLARAVSILLDNVAKHAPGGEVTLRAARVDGAVAIEVEDCGPGVPVEAQERIFGRFERASPLAQPASGLGLGLYLARQIARAHGGDLYVRSGGDGATFVLRIPATPASAAACGGAVSPAARDVDPVITP